MLLSEEIRGKRFSHALWGYHERQVREFLGELGETYDHVIRENARLKGELEELRFQVAQFGNLEGTLETTLGVVRQAVEEARQASSKEVEAIREKAEGKASFLRQHGREAVERLEGETGGFLEKREAYLQEIREKAHTCLESLERIVLRDESG